MAEFGVGAWVRVKETGALQETRGLSGRIVAPFETDMPLRAWTLKLNYRDGQISNEWESDLDLLDVPPALDTASIEAWLAEV